MATFERDLEPALTNPPGPLDVVIMDLPIADGLESDHQPWIAASAEPWPGSVAVLKSASGSNFGNALTLATSATMGRSLEELKSAQANRWQHCDWIVLLPSGGATSASRIDVLNGENVLAVEHPGGWEILQFERAELIDFDTYRLSNLLRGQRGTGHLAAADLTADARVVLLDDAVRPLPLGAWECSLTRTWRVGPAELDISHPAYVEIEHTSGCVGLKPFAPAHLRASKRQGDIDLSWVRTSRIGAESLETYEIAQSEDQERYLVAIRQTGVTLRSAEVSTPSFTYSAAAQATDGASGTLEVSVQQYSSATGFGTERTVEINV